MNKLKRPAAAALAALTLCLGLAGAGCGTGTTSATFPSSTASAAENTAESEAALDPANPVTVTFYSYSLTVPTMKDGMEHLVREFNEGAGKEKGVFVKSIPDENVLKSAADVQAGNPVDIVQQTFPNMDVARVNLGYKAYEDVFAADELALLYDGIEQKVLDLGKIDGKNYGLPFTMSTPILYINGSIFKAAGLDPEKPPKTWDEVLDAAVKIKEKTGNAGLALSASNTWVTYGLFYSNGAGIFKEDGTGVEFASEQGIEAMEKWKDFFRAGTNALGTDGEVMQQFMAGKAGMTLNTTAYLSGFNQAFDQAGWELRGTTMPSFGNKPAVPVNSGSALCIRPDSELKAKAILEFIKYATGPEGYTIVAGEIGYLPLRGALTDDPKYLKAFADANPLVRTNLTQVKSVKGTIWPAKIAMEGIKIFTDAVVKSLTTDADVGETLKKAQDDINKLY